MHVNMRNLKTNHRESNFLAFYNVRIDLATFLENIINSINDTSSKSNTLSTSFFGIHNVCPTEFGLISKKAMKIFIFSNFITGISPEIILLKIVDIYLDISIISKLIIPVGTLIFAISTDFPNKPCPIGEFTEIFPSARFASPSATIV